MAVSLKENKCFLSRIKLHAPVLGNFFTNSSGHPGPVSRSFLMKNETFFSKRRLVCGGNGFHVFASIKSQSRLVL
jgi:hypothetical protein